MRVGDYGRALGFGAGLLAFRVPVRSRLPAGLPSDYGQRLFMLAQTKRSGIIPHAPMLTKLIRFAAFRTKN